MQQANIPDHQQYQQMMDPNSSDNIIWKKESLNPWSLVGVS